MNASKHEQKFSYYFYNRITYAGAFLALFIFLMECLLFTLSFITESGLYFGVFTFVILPPFLILGLLLIPAGFLWKWFRVRKGYVPIEPATLHIDPSIPAHRNAILIFTTGIIILVAMSMIGAYKAYHYTESVAFCGILCHDVMRPEYTTYLNAPHARVKCVECHIGSGADWYVKSKFSGARQLYRVLTDTFSRPIETPVQNLRPAEEICLECHWPEKRYGTFDLKKDYYVSEEDQKSWRIRMLLPVGGNEGQHMGVHAHMNVTHDIYYVADDDKRQSISWVKSVDRDGNETVFVTQDSLYQDRSPPDEAIRQMDCIDCHNRPAHKFLPPDQLVNTAMQSGKIESTIPDIKEQALSVLSEEHTSQEEGIQAIHAVLTNFYRDKHPDVIRNQSADLDQTIEAIQTMFAENIFPEMHVRWDTHQDNIGHLFSPGCFRCHDDAHKSTSGRVISQDCRICHTIVEQGFEENRESDLGGLEFRHPTDIAELWREMACYECHTGSGVK